MEVKIDAMSNASITYILYNNALRKTSFLIHLPQYS